MDIFWTCTIYTEVGQGDFQEITGVLGEATSVINIFIMCSSKKSPYPPHGRSMEIPRGWEVFKAKILKGMCWA